MKQGLAALAVFAVLIVIVIAMMGDDDAPTSTGSASSSSSSSAANSKTANSETTEAETADETVADDAEPVAAPDEIVPGFDIVRVEPSGDAVIAGTAEPGADVAVMTAAGVIGTAQADDRGEWVVIIDEPLEPGAHEIWLEANDGGGGTVESTEIIVMSVPEAADVAAVTDGSDVVAMAETTADDIVASIESASSAEVLAVIVPREGEGDVEVLQAPGSGVGLSGGGDLTLKSLSYDEEGTVSLSGQAEPGSTVVPYLDGKAAGEAVADEEGNWRLTLGDPLEEGQYDLRVDEVNESGDVVARLATTFQQAPLTMPTTDALLVVIQPGNNLWLIARQVYGGGMHYTQIFEANRNQIADPDLIYPGQIFVLPDAVTTDG
ncbi:MAG: LysM peptidoglycan-binding domain-containing protein [Rhodospirillales bacterium]|nr:LysM peptidoglycan-binding domain-containing protein [Rhodospirillales bacterium]